MAELPDPAVKAPKTRRLDRALALIERGGNALPHPATLFVLMAAAVIAGSALADRIHLEVTHPVTGTPVRPVNLLSLWGLHRILTEMVSNFTGFAPLGTVLVAMLGITVAEGSGLIAAALKLLVLLAPRRLLTFSIVFAGLMSHTGGDIGHVLLPPLAAMVFLSVGRHPLAGIAAAFAGVSGGYGANLLLGAVDPLLAGISEEAARIVDPSYSVNPLCNYYFLAASVPVLATAGTVVTERMVEPRLGAYRTEQPAKAGEPLTPAERRGLWAALAAAVVIAMVLLAGTVPEAGFLRDPATHGLLRSPFISGIVAIVFFTGVALGIAFGLAAGAIRSDKDVVKPMGKAMETIGMYFVIVFFASQFVAYFKWTNLGLILAVQGAAGLRAAGVQQVPLAVGFVLVTATIDLFMSSSSAKWAVMAPVFVPMFMLLGYTPAYAQAAYRVGDSVTNIISPMMSYFPLIVAFMQRYDKRAGVGTLVATMLPYSVTFLVVWVMLLIAWTLLGLPTGPGAPLRLGA
jgi:aminobenzoyl-glutamate transport protein